MSTGPAEFISRFLYQVRDDERYWIPGSPPTPEIINCAVGAGKDEVGFDSHRACFNTLADVIDACTAEELESHGHGIVAKNATKHPRIVALAKLDAEQRAGIAVAAAQGLKWMEECRQWVQDHTLRNQIAKRVMTGILVAVGCVKPGYSSAQLAALLQIAASLQDCDVFVIRSRAAIVEILAANATSLLLDKKTRGKLQQLLDATIEETDLKPVLKAVDKLNSVMKK